jgi:hypothetical protein
MADVDTSHPAGDGEEAAPFTLELVRCPTCGAKPGRRCRRPSGHSAWPPHAPRVYATEWKLQRVGAPRGFYRFQGRTRVVLDEPIGDHETVARTQRRAAETSSVKGGA